MKRQFTIITLSMMLLVGMAGCGNNAAATAEAEPSGMPEKPKSLTIWPRNAELSGDLEQVVSGLVQAADELSRFTGIFASGEQSSRVG
ncbi:hypothetical protein [Paenibacillus sp. sgz500958]|uniref:hypothetical protein n=1 Tax=Paenibacillus sp. sgz500958 TaxID=3242475 RepID=UPI0036D3AA52